MIRSRLENLARTQKRPRFENLSVEQSSSSNQSVLEHNDNQYCMGTESDSDENSDPEVQIVQFDIGKTMLGKFSKKSNFNLHQHLKLIHQID